VVGSHVRHDGSGLVTTFEGRIVGVEKSKELGHSNRRAPGYSVLHVTGGCGSRHHTPIAAVVLGANRVPHGSKGIEDIINLNHLDNGVCSQFGGASRVELGDLGTNEAL
jgi:hypothetical protein